MRKLIAGLLGGLLTMLPAHAFAWGADAHRDIMRRAIELLPPELKPFFIANREEVVLRVNDPDLWRIAGWDDNPNHFLDFGVPEYGRYPFTELPREYDLALQKFGASTLKRNGLVPWRFAEQFGNLRRAFEAFKTGNGNTSNVILFAAAGAHYIQDSHQPLHATFEYDGRPGQQGVHERFESILFERFESRLSIIPAPVTPITNARDTIFDVLLASYKLVDPLLAADKEAVTGRETYDDEYFERFFVKVKPMLEQRLTQSITATASYIVGAWQEAGRPQLRLKVVRPLQRVNVPK